MEQKNWPVPAVSFCTMKGEIKTLAFNWGWPGAFPLRNSSRSRLSYLPADSSSGCFPSSVWSNQEARQSPLSLKERSSRITFPLTLVQVLYSNDSWYSPFKHAWLAGWRQKRQDHTPVFHCSISFLQPWSFFNPSWTAQLMLYDPSKCSQGKWW